VNLSCLLIIGAVAFVPAQPRDVPAPQSVGTGHIAGTVMTDGSPALAVRRAVVMLTDLSRGGSRTTVADDRGQFSFETLPSGRFMLSASKGGYVKSMYGATRPGGMGVPLALLDGARMTGLELTLVRGGVITGVLRDRSGAPVRNVRVNAGRRGAVIDDRRALTDSAGGSGETDDRGAYRIYGLRPGEYFVWATAPLWVEAGITRLTTDDDLQRARQLVQMGRGGAPQTALMPATTSASGVRYADSYYPRTASPAHAAPVRVGPGEERAGIDLTLLLIPTARLAGSVVSASGSPTQNPRVWIRPEGTGGTRQQFELRTAPDGTFEVPHVMPGNYLIGAEGRAPADRTQWARLPVSVDGADQTDLVLRLQHGMTVTGRVVFEAGAVQAPSAAGRSIKLVEGDQSTLHTIPEATTAPDGSFVVEGVAAGSYRIVLTTANSARMTTPAGWMLKSITGAGPDLADVPLEVRADADVPPLTVTLTSRTTELSGSLVDPAGRPVTAFTVVVFSADRVFWTSQSRRTQSTRPADDGRFILKNLPAGDYFVAALADADDLQWSDPRVLAELATAGVRVTIVDGQRTVQDLRIAYEERRAEA
jgi:hypothetical protein